MKVLLTFLALAFSTISGSTHGINQLQNVNRFSKFHGRIVNGYSAEQGKVPYIVGLKLENANTFWYCGGSIISNKWILTAAHCTLDADNSTIYYGSVKHEKGKIIHTVEKKNFIQHPDYNTKTDANDIALIRTPHVQFSNAIKKIKLAQGRSSYAGKVSLACGWGLLFTKGSTPEILQCVKLTVIGNSKCQQWNGITNKQLCVNTFKADICDGDSGGPLVVENELVGVTSFGTITCKTGVPSVFTRVSAYLNWIQKVAGVK